MENFVFLNRSCFMRVSAIGCPRLVKSLWASMISTINNCAAENDDTTESVVVLDDDVDPCGGGGSSEL